MNNVSALRRLWLAMLILTAGLLFISAETGDYWPVTLFAGVAALVKGNWIIQDFMEMKRAPAVLRRTLRWWLMVTVSVVTAAAIVQQ